MYGCASYSCVGTDGGVVAMVTCTVAVKKSFCNVAVPCNGRAVGCVTGYQVIRVIRIFAKTYPFE